MEVNLLSAGRGTGRDKEKAREYHRAYREANAERLRKRAKELREERKEAGFKRVLTPDQSARNAERAKAWRLANKERAKASVDDWHKKNPGVARAAKAKYRDNQRSTPKGRLSSNVSRSIHRGLKRGGKNGARTFEILGYTVEELMIRLERQFTEGMTWENYGSWHIDHIVPLSAFNYETVDDIDFARAWSLGNLQPLWAADNLSKNDRIDKPFQPSLCGV